MALPPLDANTRKNLIYGSVILVAVAGFYYLRVYTPRKADIETLTAESKMSARILALLPLGVFILINVINREFMAPMLASQTGIFMFVFAALSVMAGYWMMMKIADIDI